MFVSIDFFSLPPFPVLQYLYEYFFSILKTQIDTNKRSHGYLSIFLSRLDERFMTNYFY